ncbi:Conserved_hypothetical protein [Hexamita inflata]|uniref:Uncharacterized protein n=1 Tax=Hexamita inflata TaxID=28002 RepID=A0AA86QNP4_9EUKA|nr:Conserved hypothetical protein [Hexamita inflata]
MNLDNFLDELNHMDELLDSVSKNSISQAEQQKHSTEENNNKTTEQQPAEQYQQHIEDPIVTANQYEKPQEKSISSEPSDQSESKSEQEVDNSETLLQIIQEQDRQIQQYKYQSENALQLAKEQLRSEAERKLRERLGAQIKQELQQTISAEYKQIIMNQLTQTEIETLCFDFIEKSKAALKADYQKQIQLKLNEIERIREDSENKSKVKQAETQFKRQIQQIQLQKEREIAQYLNQNSTLKKKIEQLEQTLSENNAHQSNMTIKYENLMSKLEQSNIELNAKSNILKETQVQVLNLQQELEKANENEAEIMKMLETQQTQIKEQNAKINEVENEKDIFAKENAKLKEQIIFEQQKQTQIEKNQFEKIQKDNELKLLKQQIEKQEKEQREKEIQQNINKQKEEQIQRENARKIQQEKFDQQREQALQATKQSTVYTLKGEVKNILAEPKQEVTQYKLSQKQIPQSTKDMSKESQQQLVDQMKQKYLTQYQSSIMNELQPEINLTIQPVQEVQKPQNIKQLNNQIPRGSNVVSPQKQIIESNNTYESIMVQLQNENEQQQYFTSQKPLEFEQNKLTPLLDKALAFTLKLWDQNETSFTYRNQFMQMLQPNNVAQAIKIVKEELNKQKQYQEVYGNAIAMIQERELTKSVRDDSKLVQKIVAECKKLGSVFYRGIDYIEILKIEGLLQ